MELILNINLLKPLEPFHDKMLVLKKLHNRVRGDGDNHMRGMSCLLTGIELFPVTFKVGKYSADATRV